MKISTGNIRVGISMGDPSGIGPAIICQALNKLKGKAGFVVIGDEWVFRKAAEKLGQKLPDTVFVDLNNVSRKDFAFGRVRPEFGRASIDYLDKALELIRAKKIDCLVTAPISKEALKLAGLPYRGHTEYFAKRLNKNPVMMLLNDRLRFSLVTRHISIKELSPAITSKKLSQTIRLTRNCLKELFCIKRPRIVVSGLNPHASDNGLIGKEENRIIKPTLKQLRGKLKSLVGPLSADVAIHQAALGEFDCVIAMYHDQALIPLKLSDADSGVNITLGLSFIRTSPLHGTAFDISNRPLLANPASLISAIRLAISCATNQKKA